MVQRIKILSECLSTYLAITVQFFLLAVSLAFCTVRKRETTHSPVLLKVSAIESSPVNTPNQQHNAVFIAPPSPSASSRKRDEPATPVKRKSAESATRKRKKEPEVKAVEKKEPAVVKQSIKQNIKEPKEVEVNRQDSSDPVVNKAKEKSEKEKSEKVEATCKGDDDDEFMIKLEPKEEPEPKTDLDSHRDDMGKTLKGSKRRKNKKKVKETEKGKEKQHPKVKTSKHNMTATEKAEKSETFF